MLVIRTQTKDVVINPERILKVKDFIVKQGADVYSRGWKIFAYTKSDEQIFLGEYETEKETDEQINNILTAIKNTDGANVIYYMDGGKA